MQAGVLLRIEPPGAEHKRNPVRPADAGNSTPIAFVLPYGAEGWRGWRGQEAAREAIADSREVSVHARASLSVQFLDPRTRSLNFPQT